MQYVPKKSRVDAKSESGLGFALRHTVSKIQASRFKSLHTHILRKARVSLTTFIFQRGHHTHFFLGFPLGMFSTSRPIFALKERSKVGQTAACMAVFRRERNGALGFKFQKTFFTRSVAILDCALRALVGPPVALLCRPSFIVSPALAAH